MVIERKQNAKRARKRHLTKNALKNIARIQAPQIPPLEIQFTTYGWWQPREQTWLQFPE